MADYRELLRRAIDALPDNTGANRRAVYEKARGALVAQLRAIEPPLPAREITTHRLNLEDCIRQVEQEATDRLLGRLRAVEDEPLSEPVEELVAPEPEDYPEPAEPQWERADEEEPAEQDIPFEDEPIAEPEIAVPPEPVPDEEEAGHQEALLAPASEPAQSYQVGASASSIEDIIAAAEGAYGQEPVPGAEAEILQDVQPEPTFGDAPPQPVDPVVEPEPHFSTPPFEPEPRAEAPAVDLNETPDGGAEATIGAAMSSVREVEIDPAPRFAPEVSDAQVAIDRAIAALDREARGEDSGFEGAASTGGDAPDADASEAGEGEGNKPRGLGALTVFLLIAILLLGGGGAAGFWAWREGYIDLNTIFAQSGPVEPAVEVAETPEPLLEPVPVPSGNTTPEVPETPAVNGEAMPGEELPVVETETPGQTASEPEIAFEDRLPAETAESLNGEEEPISEEAIEAASAGPQSLLLEEQASGAVGAVPYSGSVEWSRGTDEMGHPTILAEASIPARNLDVRLLIRRNADTNLPASHLMEVNFTVAESFVGGSIANLPGVLLKDEELVQGQPLTGASARIVGNSFLFALSGASERDIANNETLLAERGWIDLAMVYGTGRRAILTLEKGEDGDAIFAAVMEAWAALDAQSEAAAE